MQRTEITGDAIHKSRDLTVTLENVGNPDFRQDPNRPLYGTGGKREVKVSSLAGAASVCQRYIEEHELGGGNWSGGQVRESGVEIAYISYNGRIWAR